MFKKKNKSYNIAESLSDNNDFNTKYVPGLGIRHLQSLLMFLCLFVAYGMRVNLSVAIVAMVDKSSNPDFEEFDWDPSIKSIVLSSFFWGYILGQIPGGQLAQVYGPKILLLILMGICSVLNILTPSLTSYGGWKAICTFRAIQGLSQSIIFPCTHTMMSKWAPLSERGRMSTFSYAGAQLGSVVMLSMSGILAESVLGWPGIFYISGIAGLLWTILWYFFGCNSPAQYKKIPQSEREFIEQSLGTTDIKSKRFKTPWKSIFTSIPFYALIVVNCSHNWGFCTLLIEMPTYIRKVHNLNIQKNGMLTAMPYFIMFILSLVFSYVSDTLMNKKIISTIVSRKTFNAIGNGVPMIMLIAVGYLNHEDTNLAILFLTIAIGINAACFVGYLINHMDLAPNYAGTLVGITNSIGNIMSIFAPLVVGVVVKNENDPAEWRTVFLITAGIYFIGEVTFLIFGRTKIQKWNYYNTNTTPNTAL